MGHSNFTGNIQTQAGAGCGALRIFPAIKPLKNATLLIPGNRAAIVRDPDRNELTLAFDRNRHDGTGLGILASILDQLIQCEPE